MTGALETLLREAQADIAARAPHVDHVLAGLPERTRLRRARRRRRAVLTTLVIAAVVAVPVALSQRSTRPAKPPVAPSVAAAQVKYPLGWSLTWIPPGYTESSRVVNLQDGGPTGSVRLWTTKPTGTSTATAVPAGIELIVGPALQTLERTGSVVDIGGKQGRYVPPSVRWNVESNFSITVTASHVTVSKADLLRIARGVIDDSAVALTAMPVAGLPAGFVATAYRQGGTPDDHYQGVLLRQGDQRIDVLASRVSPVRGTSRPLGPGTLVTWTDDAGTPWQSVVVPLPGGKGRLTVSGTAQVDPGALLNVATLTQDPGHLTEATGIFR